MEKKTGSYTFTQLVDVVQIQQLLESHFRLTGVLSAILDTDENILVAVGWQDICTRFHRVNPRSCLYCKESDAYVKAHLADCSEGFLGYKCKNGLWDVAMPIIVDGEHLATFFTGQFFYEGEKPDMDFFRHRAEEFGFDAEEYLEAVNRVPVFSPEFIYNALRYYRNLVAILTEMGLKNLKLVREIDERKQVERALGESNATLGAITTSAHDAIIMMDPTGRISFWNSAAEQIFGWKKEDVLDRELHLLLAPERYHESCRAGMRIFAAGGRGDAVGKALELDALRRDGSEISVELSLSSVQIRGEWHAIGVVRDITERKRAEKSLKNAKEYIENLIQGANVIIVGRDREGNVNLFNRKAEEVSGYTFAEVAGRRWFDMDSDTDARSVRVREQDGHDTFETRISTKSGEERIISWRDNPVIENGELVGIVSFGIDITEHRRLEEQHRQALKMESVGRLAGGVAHDFNNMLCVIMGHAELSKKKVAEDDPLKRNLEEILNAATRSRDVTRQLLAFSRKELVSPKPVNLNMLVRRMQQTLGRLIGEDVDLSFRPTLNLWSVRIDPSQVDQILVNLSVNARDAMPGGGSLDIETANVHLDSTMCRLLNDAGPGDYVRISVSDSGIGMSREIMEHIFEPFFTTKEVGKGTGLGLATVYGIVRQNDGFIRVSSEPGKGTAFDIYFPRLLEEPKPEPASAPVVPWGTERILLVEDDVMVRDMVTDMLEQIGYTVVTADCPEAALSICEQGAGKIDLILTDVVMPGMNGREMMEAISAVKPGVRALFMSGYSAELIEQRGVMEKAMHFIQKPFDSAALYEKIREALA
jgi:PAS domain S-box-containing protein